MPSRPPLPYDPSEPVPDDPRRVYDVRDVIRALVDGGELLEVAAGWARNLVTGFARIDGRAVGVVASQPRYLGGIIDADASQKGARFVSKCNAFGIPLLVLVDTPGYMTGDGAACALPRADRPPGHHVDPRAVRRGCAGTS